MARIRSTHPGQWTDEDFVSCSFAARLLAIAIRNEADDTGVFEWKPVGIKMRLFPADSIDVTALLAELEGARQVKRFSVNGHVYGAIRNFCKYQRPKKPKSVHPIPDELRTYVAIDASSTEPSADEEDDSSEPVPNSARRGRRKEEGDKNPPPTSSIQPVAILPIEDGKPDDRFDHIRRAVWRQSGLTDDQIGTKLVRATSEGLANIRRWLAADLDEPAILDAIADAYTSAESRGETIRQPWTYLDRVMETAVERKAEPAVASPQAKQLDDWRGRLQSFTGPNRVWSSMWGPKPGYPGCEAPAAVLGEFGFGAKQPHAPNGAL